MVYQSCILKFMSPRLHKENLTNQHSAVPPHGKTIVVIYPCLDSIFTGAFARFKNNAEQDSALTL